VGALVMRGMMIWLGVSLVSRFHFILYVFGRFSAHHRDSDGLQQTANGFWRQLVPADVPQINAGNARLSWFPFHGAN